MKEPDHTWFTPRKKVVLSLCLAAVVGSILGSSTTPAHGAVTTKVVAAVEQEPESTITSMLDGAEVKPISVETSVPAVADAQPAPPPPPPIGEQALAVAYGYVGTPYVYNGAGPDGFDCSGLVMFTFAQLGIDLPHGADDIASLGVSVSEADAIPGDIVWYPGQHVGLWVSPGLMLDSPTEGRTVSVNAIWGDPIIIRLPY